MVLNTRPNLVSSALNSIPSSQLKKPCDGIPPCTIISGFCTGADCRGGSLALWGGAAVVGLLLLGNKIPVVKDDILKKIPLVRGYFIEQDNIPDSDKPF
jgi:hypothetical protein